MTENKYFQQAVNEVEALTEENWGDPKFRAGVHVGTASAIIDYTDAAKDESEEVQEFVRRVGIAISLDCIAALMKEFDK